MKTGFDSTPIDFCWPVALLLRVSMLGTQNCDLLARARLLVAWSRSYAKHQVGNVFKSDSAVWR